MSIKNYKNKKRPIILSVFAIRQTNERTSAVIGNDIMNKCKIAHVEKKKESMHKRREKRHIYKRIKKTTMTCRNMTRS